MSVAEKLRALGAEGAFGRWSIYEEESLSGGEPYIARWIAEDDYPSADGTKRDGVLLSLDPCDLSENRARLIVALRNALPEIIALVEAAESVREVEDYVLSEYQPDGTEFQRALAALDAKLTAAWPNDKEERN